MNKLQILVASLPLLIAGLLVISTVALAPVTVYAATPTVQPSPDSVDPAVKSGNCADLSKCTLISNFINPFIIFLSALVGVAVASGIIYGGIQYGSSGGDPQKVASGKKHIMNAILGLLAYIFLMAMLNFLVPGGIL